MTARQRLTAEDYAAWRRVNAATLEKADADARADLVDALVRNVVQHANWGEQAALRNAWRCIGRHQTHAQKAFAEEELVGMGWQRKRKGAAE